MRMLFRDRLTIFLRSFAVQGSWNFPRMQGLGFLYVLTPWLRKVSGEGFQEACRRHLGYFNTHPFLVSYIAGVVARMELEGRSEESVRMRDSLMGPLGATGDGLFWARVRPAAVLLGLALSFYWPWAAAPVFLLTFNAVHLSERWYGVEAGFGKNEKLLGGVDGKKKKVISTFSGQMIMPTCGFILGVFAFHSQTPLPALALFGLGFLLFLRKMKTPPVFAYLLAAALLLGALGVRMRLPWSM